MGASLSPGKMGKNIEDGPDHVRGAKVRMPCCSGKKKKGRKKLCLFLFAFFLENWEWIHIFFHFFLSVHFFQSVWYLIYLDEHILVPRGNIFRRCHKTRSCQTLLPSSIRRVAKHFGASGFDTLRGAASELWSPSYVLNRRPSHCPACWAMDHLNRLRNINI